MLGCIGELWLTACRPKCQAGLGGTSASNRGPTTGVRLSSQATDPDVHLLEIHSYVPHPKPQMCCELVMLIVSKHLPHALPCSPLHWQDQTTPPPGDQDCHSHGELQNMYCISSVWISWFANRFLKYGTNFFKKKRKKLPTYIYLHKKKKLLYHDLQVQEKKKKKEENTLIK